MPIAAWRPPTRESGDSRARERARFSAWYEMFPRSSFLRPVATERCKIASRGWVTLPAWATSYFLLFILLAGVNRKERTTTKRPLLPTWGVRGRSERKKAGTRRLIRNWERWNLKRLETRAEQLGLELALDIAFQCSPDHPYVKEHREWFRFRPDGRVQYAENPPKKYQDIYPLDFETAH